MKNLKLCVLSSILFASACTSDEISLSKVPDAIKTYIETNHPDYTLDEAEHETFCGGGTGYEVEIEKGEEEGLTLIFDENSQFLFAKTEITMAELPAAVVNSIAANYAGFKSEEPARLTAADGAVRYEVDLEKGKTEKDVQFDPEGSIICEQDGD